MPAFTKFNQYEEDKHHGVHNFSVHQLVIALTNVAPVVTQEVLSEITQISYTNCSSRSLTINSSAQVSGTYRCIIADTTITAAGGAVGPFRYAVVYNDTPTSPADPLIGFVDYGTAVTLADGETIDIDFDDVNGAISS